MYGSCLATYKIIFCFSDSVISIGYKLTEFYEMCSTDAVNA